MDSALFPIAGKEPHPSLLARFEQRHTQTSPPWPPSPWPAVTARAAARRPERGGNVISALDEGSEHPSQDGFADGSVGDAEDGQRQPLKRLRSTDIVCGSHGVLVHAAVDLENKAKGRTVEIDDEAGDELLPTKLQAKSLTIAQDSPRGGLGMRRLSTKPLSALDFRRINSRMSDDASRLCAASHAPSFKNSHAELSRSLLSLADASLRSDSRQARERGARGVRSAFFARPTLLTAMGAGGEKTRSGLRTR
jgi:hypothetical protein